MADEGGEMTAAASDWLTPEEAAAWLRIPVKTILQLCRERRLPAAKNGRRWRLPRAGLDRLLAEVADASVQVRAGAGKGRAVSGGRSARGPQCGEIDEHLVVNDRQQPRARGHDVAGKACELGRVVGQP